MHHSSYANMKNFVKDYLNPNKELIILDIGSQDVSSSGENSFKPLFKNDFWKYYGCDLIEGPNVDIVLNDIYKWKSIKSNSVDVVVSGQTFEHIEFFWATMLEISRVLKPGGLCCIIAPSAGKRHRYPLDCWRYYEDGLSALSKYAHLVELKVQTQRNRFDFPEYDELWMDSVLIAMKPKQKLIKRIGMFLKYKCSYFLVKDISEVNRKMPILVESQLFFDCNSGYSQDQSLWQEVEVLDESYNVVFDLNLFPQKNNILQLRFDPATQPIRFNLIEAYVVSVDGNKQKISIENTNGTKKDDLYFEYPHDDPIIIFNCSLVDFSNSDYVMIKGRLSEKS